MANQNLNNRSEQFNEKEPRLAAFKALFGVLHTTTFNDLGNELFGKGFPTYPEEIIFKADTIKQAASPENIIPSRTRTWITASATSLGIDESIYNGLDSVEKLIRGHFSTSISDDVTSNPFVEKLILPLAKVAGTQDQFYFVYSKESQSADEYNQYDASETDGYNTKEIRDTYLLESGSYILKNFINPFKFGKGYNAKYFEAATFGTTPYEIPGNQLFIEEKSTNQTSGVIFDYKEGGLFVTAQPDTSTEHNLDPNLAGSHPLWIEAYRYYGPVGISGPQHTITASNVQIDNNLNVDGAITLQGFSFADVNSFTTSGSSTFGDEQTDTHQFTGSVSISGSLNATASHAITASFATNAGQSGITTTIISNSIHDDLNGYYDITTLTPTDGNDVIEYKTTGTGLVFSSSIGTSSFINLIGSKSSTEITKPDRSGDGIDSTPIAEVGLGGGNNPDDMPLGGWNGGDIFQYSTSSNNRDYPNFASYGAFKYGISNYHYSTHSFSFNSPKKITKLGLWYGKAQNQDPRTDYETSTNTILEFQRYVEGIHLSGSHDGNTWVGLYQINNLDNQRTSSVVDGNITSTPIITSSKLNTSTPPKDFRWNNLDSNLNNQDFYLLNFTSSYFDSSKYKYYKLAISGGAQIGGQDINDRYHYIHHVDLWEDKDFGEGNRKQINIGFDDTIPDGETLTNFQSAVSSAASLAGFEGFTLPEDQAVVNGIAQANLDMNGNSINNTGTFSGDSLNLNFSSIIGTNQSIGNTLTVEGQSTFNDHIKVGSGKSIYMDVNIGVGIPSSSIILKELNPIYFTGQNGINEFTSRIFGHTTEENVNDLYYDAFRHYMVSDKEIRLIALHPEGTITISSSKTLITGSLEVQGDILQNGLAISAGGGSGFPHDQTIQGGITASITGSLIISGGLNSLPFIEFGNIPVGDYNHESNNTLYVKNNGLYFGGTLVSQTTNNWHVENSAYSNSHLTSSKDIFVDGHITASGIISASSFIGDGSSLTGIPVGFPYSGSDSLNNNPKQAVITGSLYLSGSGYITASNITADSLSTINDVQVGNFGNLQDHFIKVRSNGDASNYWSSGIKLNHASENYGFTFNSKNGPSIYGLHILAHNDDEGISSLFIDRATRKIGLGTEFPWEYLHVNEGNIQIGGINEGDQAGEGDHALKLFTLGGEGVVSSSKIEFRHGSSFYGFDIHSKNGSSLYGLNFQYYNDSLIGHSAMFINRANGNVGIGTTSPLHTLTIQGNVSASGILYVEDRAGIGGVEPSNVTQLHVAEPDSKFHTIRVGGPEAQDTNNRPKIEFVEQSAANNNDITHGFSIEGNAENSDDLHINRYASDTTTDGNTIITIKRDKDQVGINTTNPGKELEVVGSISASGLLFANTTDANNNDYKTLLVDTSTGRFYHTGSYGGGTGGGGTDDDWKIETSIITSSRDIKINTSTPTIELYNTQSSIVNGTTIGSIEFSSGDFNGNGNHNIPHEVAFIQAIGTQTHSSESLQRGSGLKFSSYRNNSINSLGDYDSTPATLLELKPDRTLFNDGIQGKSGGATFNLGRITIKDEYNASNPQDTSEIQLEVDEKLDSTYRLNVRVENSGSKIFTNSQFRPIMIGHYQNGADGSRTGSLEVHYNGDLYARHLNDGRGNQYLRFDTTTKKITYTTSTIKTKKNIKSLDESTFNDVLKLTPCTYNRKNPEILGTELGLIAEEASQANPLFATYGKNFIYDDHGKIKRSNGIELTHDDKQVPANIDWNAITTALIGKIQSLEKRILELENKNQ